MQKLIEMDLSPAFEGLTDKQRLYVEGRLRGLSRIAAARAAGAEADPKKSADQYEKNPKVAAALEKARQISIQHTGYTRQKIAEMLQRAYDLAGNATEMVMAARELGRLHGVYAPTNVKVDHEHRLTDTRNVEDLRHLTTEQLEQLVAKRGGDFIEGEFVELEPLRLTDERKKEAQRS
jgi:phage terminase small subunit